MTVARVSVEQKALTDPRFDLLGRKLGTTRHDALGRMLLVWNECQERATHNLPVSVIEVLFAVADAGALLVACELAEWKSRLRGTVRIKGTEGRIEWLEQRRRNGLLGAEHGRKGGRPRKTPHGVIGKPHEGLHEKPPPAPAPAPAPAQKTEEKESASQSVGEAPPPTATKPDELAVEAKPKKPRATPNSPHHRSIAVFTDGWRNRYGETYPFNAGKDAEAFKAMLAHVGGDEAKLAAVIGRYLADDDEFAAKARHSIGVLRSQFAKWLVDTPPVIKPRGGFKTITDTATETLTNLFGDRPHDQHPGPRIVAAEPVAALGGTGRAMDGQPVLAAPR